MALPTVGVPNHNPLHKDTHQRPVFNRFELGFSAYEVANFDQNSSSFATQFRHRSCQRGFCKTRKSQPHRRCFGLCLTLSML
ncbi:hypothetical protein GOP47_0000471 [Adiantum capillus-veneris]|uniref:Uncharacterized protein n=1 Tax=Adiantum capillus-veneris TaxID=13818 RepID=A0A9D4VDL1_ADICA|nr:hypothetical protein GOP47_0000471 [Adiantum capillus-veneris]